MKSMLENTGLFLDLAIKIVLLSIIPVVFCFPETIAATLKSAFTKAGVENVKLNLFGVQLDFPIGALEGATETIALIESELKDLQTAQTLYRSYIVCLANDSCSTADHEGIDQIADNDPTAANTQQTELVSSLNETRTALQDALVAKASPIITDPPKKDSDGQDWVVVFGADKSLSEAEFERLRVARMGYETEILQRGSWLRSVAFFGDQISAITAAREIGASLGRDVFPLAMADWCPTLTETRNGIRSCNTEG